MSFAEHADGMVMSVANLVCSQMPAPVLVVECSSVSTLPKQAEAEAKPMRDSIELQCSEHAVHAQLGHTLDKELDCSM